jgi:hypothetical protein
MQVSKKFIEESERIANHFQVPTKVIIDAEGLHIEIGGPIREPSLPPPVDALKRLEI